MNEHTVRDVLTTVAAHAEMPTRFQRPGSIVSDAKAKAGRPPHRWLRATAVSAAALLLGAFGTLAIPNARAFASGALKSLVTLWEGKVGEAESKVVWIEPSLDQSRLENLLTATAFQSMDEAAAAAGFRPPEPAGAQLLNVLVQVGDTGQDTRLIAIVANYNAENRAITVLTSVNARKDGDQWVLRPYKTLTIADQLTYPMENIRPRKLGEREALSFEQPLPNDAREFSVAWLHEGLAVRVTGSDPKLVEQMARATAK